MKHSSSRQNKSRQKSVKSISTLITKKNHQQQSQRRKNPYFHPDHIRDTIEKRMQIQKENFRERTLSPHTDDHLGKAGQIIKDLFKRHEHAKQKLKRMKQETQKKYNEIHPFQPNKTKSFRYNVDGDVVKRNEIWLREKKKRQLQLKQQITLNKLKQCTFSPKFSSKKQSQQYLKSRQVSRSNTPSKQKSRYNTEKETSPFKSGGRKRDYTEQEYEMAKRNIVSRMMGSLRD